MMDDIVDMETESNGSSVGDAVSGRQPDGSGSVGSNGMFYLDERRPSLELAPVNLSHWDFVDRALSPMLSYMSMTSEGLSVRVCDETENPTTSFSFQLIRSDSDSCSCSLDSDDDEMEILRVTEPPVEPPVYDDLDPFFDTPEPAGPPEKISKPTIVLEMPTEPNEFSHPSVTVAFTFKVMCDVLTTLSDINLESFKNILWSNFPKVFKTFHPTLDKVNLVDSLLETFSLALSLKITLTVLEKMGLDKAAANLQHLCLRNKVRHCLRETLKQKYSEERVPLGGHRGEENRPVDHIFTPLIIRSKGHNGPNTEHEVLNIERLDTNKDVQEVSLQDIFPPQTTDTAFVWTVLVSGVAGSGKSMLFRRFVLDWCEERTHQHIYFLFPFSAKELQQFENSKVSFLDIIQTLYPEAQELSQKDCQNQTHQTLFVCDGLDECHEMLDFSTTTILSDISEAAPLQVILVNLLRGRLLHHSLLLGFTRPQTLARISWDTHYQNFEVLGFSTQDRDEYFRTRFKNPEQAARVINYVHSSSTLRIMCHLPLFCALVSDEWEDQGPDPALTSRTITYMYTKLILTLVQQRRAPDSSVDKERDFLMRLGKLAFNMLQRGSFKMTRHTWKELEKHQEVLLVNAGLCTEYVTRPHFLVEEKMLSFLHPTVQEYLAAFYVFVCSRNQGENVFEQRTKKKGLSAAPVITDMYGSAVDASLHWANGQLDIFLRFLCGLARKDNQELLQPLCGAPAGWSTDAQPIAAIIRKRLKENKYPDRKDNLLRCLEEMNM